MFPATGECRQLYPPYEFGSIFIHYYGEIGGLSNSPFLLANIAFWMGSTISINLMVIFLVAQARNRGSHHVQYKSRKSRRAELSVTLTTFAMILSFLMRGICLQQKFFHVLLLLQFLDFLHVLLLLEILDFLHVLLLLEILDFLHVPLLLPILGFFHVLLLFHGFVSMDTPEVEENVDNSTETNSSKLEHVGSNSAQFPIVEHGHNFVYKHRFQFFFSKNFRRTFSKNLEMAEDEEHTEGEEMTEDEEHTEGEEMTEDEEHTEGEEMAEDEEYTEGGEMTAVEDFTEEE
ncbi:hypothetical protein GCK72_015310 [Caenorhabditis remanei]|uniref:Serpentine receptor class gamma n=1 Tax=Caenorhabditis remanei TaxID=31234 RepID=A0A6A5GTQ7_CAERE|nr:hypothetical protein GCK72_015310 [Caenorhabditis remanei]KAF1758850.1 hypothetical protein GCK72_015310 [Caenorhabditis remanei]